MSRLGRLASAFSAVLLVSLTVTTVPASASKSGPPLLAAKPPTKLQDTQAIHVRGERFTPGDMMELIECQRGATNPTGCDPATVTGVTVNAKGHIPPTAFTVRAGLVGTGTCGTSKTDKYKCEITADDLTTATQFVASVKIGFGAPTSPIPTPPSPPGLPGSPTRRD